MEKSNFNKAYVYIVGIFAIGIAISNIISFFHGVGFALVGASLLLILTITNILKDEENKKRFGDIFILIAFEFLMFIVLFFAYDFNLNGITNKFPLVMRNICAIYSILSLGYVVFRYVSEIKGKRYIFVEYILGNYTPDPTAKKEKKAKLSKEQIKKNKELENGTLAPKPSSIENSNTETEIETEESKEEIVENAEENNTQEASTDTEEKPTTTEPTTTNRTGYWY